MKTTAERAVALAEAGCSVELTIRGTGYDTKIKGRFQHGGASSYEGPGIAVNFEGIGLAGLVQIEAALSAMEAYAAATRNAEHARSPAGILASDIEGPLFGGLFSLNKSYESGLADALARGESPL